MVAPADASGSGAPLSVDASRERIENSDRWYQVLDVSIIASPEDVKSAYKKLSLLHHPDKGGDADTFHKLKQSYEEGLAKRALKPKAAIRKSVGGKKIVKSAGKAKAKGKAKSKKFAKPAQAAAKEKPKAKAKANAEDAAKKAPAQAKAEPEPPKTPRGAKRAWPKPAPAPPNATRKKIQNAMEKWDISLDYKMKTFPYEIQVATCEELEQWRTDGLAVPIDARESTTGVGPVIRSAVRLSYMELLGADDDMIALVRKLKEDGNKLVMFTQTGERMSQCGLLGALLLDVFQFDELKLYKLEGGVDGWTKFVELNPLVGAEEVFGSAEATYDVSKRKLDKAALEHGTWTDAQTKHFDVLVAGLSENEAAVRSHLQKMSLQTMTLDLEESVNSMFEYASAKELSKRGRWDKYVFDEIRTRFDAKISCLSTVEEACRSEADQHEAQVDAAGKRLKELQEEAAQKKAAEPKKPAQEDAGVEDAEEVADEDMAAEDAEEEEAVAEEAEEEEEKEVDEEVDVDGDGDADCEKTDKDAPADGTDAAAPEEPEKAAYEEKAADEDVPEGDASETNALDEDVTDGDAREASAE